MEAFSDGVLAIIITIMVLELKVPHSSDFAALAPLLPVFLSYVLSFVYLAIYWNNHHHMLHVTSAINGTILSNSRDTVRNSRRRELCPGFCGGTFSGTAHLPAI
jgi:uncharacterized membrane protein